MSFNVCFILVFVLQSSNSLSSQYRVALLTFALTLLCMFQLLLLHIEYWAFRCTDSFSMDWITVKFIGCGVTGFSANTPVFLSNSDFSKTPITPHVSCHVLVMSWEHNGSIFDAALVGKWLHIWNVCSAICSTKMSVSWWVLVRFWVFRNPYESSCVLPCPEHVLPCPGHVLGMFKSC